MSLNNVTSSERVHIGFFGCTNAGKSSLVNALTNQGVALVSDVRGTTTDIIRKAMELLPIGPVMIVDTPGFDDDSQLGKERIKNTKKAINEVDVAVLVCDALSDINEADREIEKLLLEKKIPYITVFNKADEKSSREDNKFYVSAKTGEGIEELKKKLASLVPEQSNKMRIVDSFVKKGDTVILVTPIDESAPKGRIILPQQNVLRNLLDIGATNLVVQPENLASAICGLKEKPKCVITDSQVFGEVSKIVPDGVLLTSFSILFASYKGVLEEAVKTVIKIEELKDGDKILVAEGCTHHRQCNDIGTVKIPAWIKKHTGKSVEFEFTSGKGFPDDLSPYAIVVHCGGCMITEKEVMSRMEKAKEQNIPFTNYGILISYMNGILKKSIEVFPEIYKQI